jgi:hypothetical protein
MSVQSKRKPGKKQRKRDANQIVAELVSEIYDQLAAEMVVALYRKKREIISKLT